MSKFGLLRAVVAATLAACGGDDSPRKSMEIQDRLDNYTTFRLEADLDSLTEKQRQMLPLLMEAADIMDGLFQRQAYGDMTELLSRISDPALRRYVEINYGPWDRLAGNEPFVDGVGPKPLGAGFYPADMTKEEFDAAVAAEMSLELAIEDILFRRRRGPAEPLYAGATR